MTAASSKSDILLEFASPTLSPPLLQSLLHRLFSHPSIYNGFLPILDLPSVQSALNNNPQRQVIVRTVELFGYGSFSDYREANEDAVMKLNDAQLEKLRMLTVVSIIRDRIEKQPGDGDVDMDTATSRRKLRRERVLSIPYSALFAALHLPTENTRQLEDILIQCIYNNLLCGKLDQCSKCLVIEPHLSLRDGTNAEICGSFLSRDVPPSSPSISKMTNALESFLHHSESLLATLEKCTLINASVRKNDEIRWKEVQRMVSEGHANVKFGALERGEMESGGGGERDRSSKRSKMQGVMRGLI